MTLIKGGPGELILNNDNDYEGSTQIWEGNITVNGNLPNSSVDVQSRGSVGGTGILGNGVTIREFGSIIAGGTGVADTLFIHNHLTLEDHATMYFELSDDTSGIIKPNDFISIDGHFILGNKNNIDLTLLDNELQAGQYKLIEYSGNLSGDVSNIAISGIIGVPFNLVNSDNSVLLLIDEIRNAAIIIWKGSESNTWDLAFSKNWINNGENDFFVVNDTVLFDDTGSGTPVVNLSGILPIGKMIVNASSDYLLQGDGYLSGEGGIYKSGSGKLVLNSSNDYTGPTIINEGTIQVSQMTNAGQPGPLGAPLADPGNLIMNGGALALAGGVSSSNRGLTLGINGGKINTSFNETNLFHSGEITGTGLLVKQGTGTLTLLGANNYSGGTLIENGTIRLGDDNANISGLGSGPVTIKNGTLSMNNSSGTYTNNCAWDLNVPAGFTAKLELDSRCSLTGSLTGGGILNLYTPFIRSELDGNWSGFTGTINVSTDSDGGWFLVSNQNGFKNAAVNLEDNVSIIYTKSENARIEIGELRGTANSILGAGGESNNNITWVIGGKNTNAEFKGTITNDQFKNTGASTSIVKEGSGNWILSSANTYSGSTTINDGSLTINNKEGSATGSGSVFVNDGTTLFGYGSINGPLTVSGNAALSINKGLAGNEFTVNNDVTFSDKSYLSLSIDSETKSYDRLIVSGKLKIDGFLYLNNSGNSDFIPGDAFYILDAGNCSGKFDEIIPPRPGDGLKWDTTYLCSHGILQVLQSPVGIESPVSGYALSLYPNPADEVIYLTISRPGLTSTHPFNLNCYDSFGRLVWQSRILSGDARYETEIDLKEMPAGIYVITFSDGKINYMKRFIKH